MTRSTTRSFRTAPGELLGPGTPQDILEQHQENYFTTSSTTRSLRTAPGKILEPGAPQDLLEQHQENY